MDYRLNSVSVVLDVLPCSGVVFADCIHDESLLGGSESLELEVFVGVCKLIRTTDRLFVIGLYVPRELNLVIE